MPYTIKQLPRQRTQTRRQTACMSARRGTFTIKGIVQCLRLLYTSETRYVYRTYVFPLFSSCLTELFSVVSAFFIALSFLFFRVTRRRPPYDRHNQVSRPRVSLGARGKRARSLKWSALAACTSREWVSVDFKTVVYRKHLTRDRTPRRCWSKM